MLGNAATADLASPPSVPGFPSMEQHNGRKGLVWRPVSVLSQILLFVVFKRIWGGFDTVGGRETSVRDGIVMIWVSIRDKDGSCLSAQAAQGVNHEITQQPLTHTCWMEQSVNIPYILISSRCFLHPLLRDLVCSFIHQVVYMMSLFSMLSIRHFM